MDNDDRPVRNLDVSGPNADAEPLGEPKVKQLKLEVVVLSQEERAGGGTGVCKVGISAAT